MPNDPRSRTFVALRDLSKLTNDLRRMMENQHSSTLDIWLKLREIGRMSNEVADLVMYYKTLYPNAPIPTSRELPQPAIDDFVEEGV